MLEVTDFELLAQHGSLRTKKSLRLPGVVQHPPPQKKRNLMIHLDFSAIQSWAERVKQNMNYILKIKSNI